MTTVGGSLTQFAIDATASLFTVQAFAAGMIAVVAHSPKFAIRDFAGAMAFVPGSLQNASVHVTIQVGSLEILDEVSKVDRREIERVMFDEVVEKAIYPTVEYNGSRVTSSKTSENVYRVNVVGDLMLHGLTRPVTLDAQVVTGEDSVRAQGSFSIMQSQFGLKIASIAGGTLKLRDELRFSYFIIGRRRD
jgi:polyisoprenoid-binding protein YceI